MERHNKWASPSGTNSAGTSKKKFSKGGRNWQGQQGRMHALYDSLPNTVLHPSTSACDSEAEIPEFTQQSTQNIQQFVDDIAATSGRKVRFMKTYFSLSKKFARTKRVCTKHKVQFSVSEKRQLGLHLLPKKGLRFEQFVPLHAMWKEYMVDFLGLEKLLARRSQGLSSNRSWEEAHTRLLKSDYHGAFLTVSKSRCAAHVGANGIVVMDTKNMFKLVGRDDIVRSIPKESSVFLLTIDDFQMTVYGKYLCNRPAERSVKKIKIRMSADL